MRLHSYPVHGTMKENKRGERTLKFKLNKKWKEKFMLYLNKFYNSFLKNNFLKVEGQNEM